MLLRDLRLDIFPGSFKDGHVGHKIHPIPTREVHLEKKQIGYKN